MILNKDCYWNILDYTFKHLHFVEDPLNPTDQINLDVDNEERCVWLKDIFEKYTTPSCSRETILSAFHILLTRDIIKIIYVAPKKDYRIIDLTSKGYEEYLKKYRVIL